MQRMDYAPQKPFAPNTQHVLEAEAKELQVQTQRFARQTQNWLALFDQFNKSLKELGDVSHWAKCIEADAQSLVATMDAVAQNKRTTRAAAVARP